MSKAFQSLESIEFFLMLLSCSLSFSTFTSHEWGEGMSAKAKKRKQIEGLTALRGLAAIWVAFHHGFLSLEGALMPESSLWHNFVLRGWLGVDLFFILSGFIISYCYLGKVSITDPLSCKSFIKKRFARVWPAHAFTLFLFAIAVTVASKLGKFSDPDGIYTIPKLVEQATMLNGVGLFEPVGWNAPSWSISSEFLAYMCFPALALLLGRFRSAGGGALLIISLLAPNIFLAYKLNAAQQYMLSFDFVWLRVLSEFLMGMAVFRIYQNINLGRWSYFIAPLCLLGIICQGFVESSFYDFTYLIYFMGLILSLSQMDLKRVPFFSYLGEISYSVYLIHSLVIMTLNQIIRMFYPEVSSSLALMTFILCSIGAGAFLYHFIESPAQKLILLGNSSSSATRPRAYLRFLKN